MTAPCAIEYILVTRWRGGKKGGQNRVCVCTRDGGVNKKLKREHPSETVAMPESGERKRNLTTLVLVKNAAVKRRRSRQKVLESSQNPLKWSCTARSTPQGRSSDPCILTICPQLVDVCLRMWGIGVKLHLAQDNGLSTRLPLPLLCS